MLAVFTVTFPFFALVLCGLVAARRELLPLAGIPGLNDFVLYFALPCMLYRLGAQTPLAQLLDMALLGVYLLCAALLVTAAVWLACRAGRNKNDAALGALVAAFPNTGFMGIPMLVALLGPQAGAPMMVILVADMVVTSSVCVALSRLDGDTATAAFTSARRARITLDKALRGVAANPTPWAITLGALASGIGLKKVLDSKKDDPMNGNPLVPLPA